GVDSEMYRRGVRPGNSANLKAGIGAGVTMNCTAVGGRQYRQVAGLVEEIARVKEPLFVDNQNAALYLDPGKKRWSGHSSTAHGQPNGFQKYDNAPGDRE